MKKIIFLAILLLVTVFLLLPQLKIPWMIIDDGESARASVELSEHFTKGDFAWLFKFEAQNGLLRPTYWLFQWANFSLLGNNSYLHHVSHLLLFVGIAILIFLLTEVISGNSFAGLMAGLFFIFFGPAAENFYRLGTGEPVLVLVLLGTLYFLIKAVKSHSLFLFSLSLIFLVFSWFSKSTVIILIPEAVFIFLLFRLFPEKKYPRASRFCLIFLLINLVLALVVEWAMIVYMIGGGYGSQYEIHPLAIWSRFKFYLGMMSKTYGPIIYVVFASLLWRFFSKFRRRRNITWEDKWLLALLSLSTLLLLIQLPWPYLMGRYLSPLLIGLSVVAGVELSSLFKQGIIFLRNGKSFRAILLVSSLVIFSVYFLWTGTKAIFGMYEKVVPGETKRSAVITFLAESIPENGRVFYNFSDGLIEFFYEMGVHFQVFYNRHDIKTALLFLDNGAHFQKGDIVVSGPPYSYRYPWDDVKQAIKNKREIKKTSDEWEIIEITSDENVLLPVVKTEVKREEKLITDDIFYFADGQEDVKIPVEKIPTAGGEITFSWRPPKEITGIEKKIALVRQGEEGEKLSNGILVWVEKNYLNFGIFDPWRNQWRILSAPQEFSSEVKYPISLRWGRGGMFLKFGVSYQFLPYYAGLNPKEDIILGPIKSKDFYDKSGRIYEFQIFPEK